MSTHTFLYDFHPTRIPRIPAENDLVVHGIGTNSFIIVRIMEPFWALMGMNMAIPIIERKGLGTGIHDEYPIEV